MVARDWIQIRTELDELHPSEQERDFTPPPEPESPRIVPRIDENSILKHIADALRPDNMDHR